MYSASEIEFDQLLEIVKSLPEDKIKLLKAAIKKPVGKKSTIKKSQLEDLLLHGPTATKTQLDRIKKNRKAINKWRTQ